MGVLLDAGRLNIEMARRGWSVTDLAREATLGEGTVRDALAGAAIGPMCAGLLLQALQRAPAAAVVSRVVPLNLRVADGGQGGKALDTATVGSVSQGGLMSAREAAEALQMSEESLRRLVRAGVLRMVTLGNTRGVSRSDVDALVAVLRSLPDRGYGEEDVSARDGPWWEP
jgi:excisionase family DNA binding protein